MQDFSDLEQDLEETTAEDSRQGKDMQVSSPKYAYCVHALVHRDFCCCRGFLGIGCSFLGSTTGWV